ncbi:hypothetical protein AGIG_G13598 [Arapaima gigas]
MRAEWFCPVSVVLLLSLNVEKRAEETVSGRGNGRVSLHHLTGLQMNNQRLRFCSRLDRIALQIEKIPKSIQ